ncbi:hypothetical protein RYX36_023029 [Vicia faba]
MFDESFERKFVLLSLLAFDIKFFFLTFLNNNNTVVLDDVDPVSRLLAESCCAGSNRWNGRVRILSELRCCWRLRSAAFPVCGGCGSGFAVVFL